MTTLPVFAYYSYATPGLPPEAGYDRAWAAALVLIVIVMIAQPGGPGHLVHLRPQDPGR